MFYGRKCAIGFEDRHLRLRSLLWKRGLRFSKRDTIGAIFAGGSDCGLWRLGIAGGLGGCNVIRLPSASSPSIVRFPRSFMFAAGGAGTLDRS